MSCKLAPWDVPPDGRSVARSVSQIPARREAVALRQTVLVLVGRGSRQEETIAELRRSTEFRRRLDEVGRIEVCLAATAEPRLDRISSRLVSDPIRQIVVQPHLLFPGSTARLRRLGYHPSGRLHCCQHRISCLFLRSLAVELDIFPRVSRARWPSMRGVIRLWIG